MMTWWMGWKLILSDRRLFATALMPFFLSFLFAIAGIYAVWVYYSSWAAWLTPAWMQGLSGFWAYVVMPIEWLIALASMLAALYAVYILHAIVASPFYSLLAERVLVGSGKAVQSAGWRGLARMLRVSVLRGALLLCVGIMLLVASFIPVINILAAAITLMVLAFDCQDYTHEVMLKGFRDRLRYSLSNRAQWLGQATALALTLILPGLTLLVIPGQVAGAAYSLKEDHDSRTASP
jgi:CysZ protein